MSYSNFTPLRYRSVFLFLIVAMLFGLAPFAVYGATLSIGMPERVEPEISYTLPVIFTGDALLNAAEIELVVNPALVSLEAFTLSPLICEERFLINTTLDVENGISYSACGTISPLQATTTPIGYVTLKFLTDIPALIEFGDHTGVYAHDGLGTKVVGR